MTTAEHRAQLRELWTMFEVSEAGPYSPLYAAIARRVADDDRLLDLVASAPPSGHLPISLLAAVHDLVLRGIDHPLRAVYDGTAPVDAAGPAFVDLCSSRWDDVLALLTARRVQTNECGRSAAIALALAEVERTVGTPAVLVDVGASGGLNLRYDRYHLDYGPQGSLGAPGSPVHVDCLLTGSDALPGSLPDVPRRVGLDRSPIDLADADDARWLLACVWPDTGRLDRIRAAIELAADDAPDVRQGDMCDDLEALVSEDGDDSLVCVVTSAAATYLGPRDRARFAETLAGIGAARPLVWVSLEPDGVVDGVVAPPVAKGFDIVPVVVGLSAFSATGRSDRAIAHAHPHGAAVHWFG